MATFNITRVILPEDQTCVRPDERGCCRCVVRTGGDILRGTVEIFGPSNRSFTVEVRLEGMTNLEPLSNL